MFERFTESARAVVVGAQREAAALGHDWVGTEHLLLAALHDPSLGVADALAARGVRYPAARDAVRRRLGDPPPVDDAAALRDLGIDVDEVRRRVEESFGPGALESATPSPAGRRARIRHRPFTRRAKAALQESLRCAVRLRSREIAVQHLLIGTLTGYAGAGLAARVVSDLGAPPDEVRELLLDQLRPAA